MKNFVDFFSQYDTGKPWLVLGKGPSFARRKEFDLSSFTVIALNHVAREQSVDFAHVIDIEVIQSHGVDIMANARYLVLPWVPHQQMRAGDKTLADWIEHIPILKQLIDEDRLLWYDLGTSQRQNGLHPPAMVRFFSSEAVLWLLAQSGVKKIRSLGLDGGIEYSAEFEDLNRDTRLANAQPTFDRQFSQFADVINKFDVDYSPLSLESPVKIFVGSTPSEWLPFKVLEYSIRKNSSLSVECLALCDSQVEIPMPLNQQNRPRTPFSFQRFLVPELKGHSGRAIYLDSDMLVLEDIRTLWQTPFDEHDLLCINPKSELQEKSRFSVMLLDCGALQWSIKDIVAELDSGRLTYESLMYDMSIAKNPGAAISANWNCLDYYEPGVSALVHYTNMSTQPWVMRGNPGAALWVKALREALSDSFIRFEALESEVKKGHIRPSLVRQIERSVDDALLLSDEDVKLDRDFIAPYAKIARKPTKGVVLLNWLKNLKAAVRDS